METETENTDLIAENTGTGTLEHIAWGVLLAITVGIAIFGVSVGVAAQ